MRSRRIPKRSMPVFKKKNKEEAKHARSRRPQLAVAGEISNWPSAPAPDKERFLGGSGAASPASPPKSVETRAARGRRGLRAEAGHPTAGGGFIACRDRQRRAAEAAKAPINRARAGLRKRQTLPSNGGPGTAEGRGNWPVNHSRCVADFSPPALPAAYERPCGVSSIDFRQDASASTSMDTCTGYSSWSHVVVCMHYG